jgi:DNA-binding response OmpR family regulator
MNKVLLVEDDRTMLSLLNTLLRFEGFDAVPLEHQEDLNTVMSFVRQENPALIILDINLRRFSGFDLLRLLKADPALKGIRVIMASGIDLRERCLGEGADSFILKPFMFDELIREIQRILNLPNTVAEG